jgi:hypothetical protein
MAPTALSNPGDGRVGFRRTRTELVAGLVHVAQVESDQLRGPARWQREPLEHLSHSVGVGDLGVEDLVVGRADSIDGDVRAGPEECGRPFTLTDCCHPDRLAVPPERVVHDCGVAEAEPSQHGIVDGVGDDAVVLGIETSGDAVEVGKRQTGEHRREPSSPDTFARQLPQVSGRSPIEVARVKAVQPYEQNGLIVPGNRGIGPRRLSSGREEGPGENDDEGGECQRSCAPHCNNVL